MGVQINQLSEVLSGSGGQQVPVYDPSQGDTRKISLTTLLAWLQTQLTIGRLEPVTQYAAPSATGFSVQITDGDEDVHLILTPAAGYADGEVVLPAVANARDKQLVIVNCTQTVAAFVVDGNGATAVTGAPTTIAAANEFFTMCYDLPTSTWYRIG